MMRLGRIGRAGLMLCGAGLLLAGPLGVAPARAQMDSREAIDLQNQILALRRDVQQLQQAGGGAAAPTPLAPPTVATQGDLVAQLLDRVSQLESEVRQLRGRIDEADNARQRQYDELSKRIGDLEFHAGIPGAAPGTVPPGGVPGNVPGGVPGSAPAAGGVLTLPPAAGVPPPPRRTPEVALQDGNAALARHDYTAAEGFAREVLASGRGPRATDAQYLLAQALAGRHAYPAAAVAFDDAYRRNPRGSRAPDSLLGLANSLTAIDARKAACETLAKLRAEFPALRPDLRALAAAARQRAGCG